MLRISRFEHVRDNIPKHIELSWGELCAMLRVHDVRPDKDGPLWSPAEFTGKRAKSNVLAVHALVYDLDHITMGQLEGVAGRVEAAGIASLIHSTFSHTPENVSARLVIRVDRPMTALEFSVVHRSVAKRLEIPFDEKAADASRMFFLPSAPQ